MKTVTKTVTDANKKGRLVNWHSTQSWRFIPDVAKWGLWCTWWAHWSQAAIAVDGSTWVCSEAMIIIGTNTNNSPQADRRLFASFIALSFFPVGKVTHYL